MQLPLRVEETWIGYKIVDAEGRSIAFAQALPWHGVPEEKRTDFVLANFQKIVDLANNHLANPQRFQDAEAR